MLCTNIKSLYFSSDRHNGNRSNAPLEISMPKTAFRKHNLRNFAPMKEWNDVKTATDFYKIVEDSAHETQIIFKDSTSCGISAHAKDRLKNGFAHIEGKAAFHYLDLKTYRMVSNLIAEELQVTHQSPQIIVLKNNKVAYTSSHQAIDPVSISEHL
jgi:bacillithiol system protein YtxJ